MARKPSLRNANARRIPVFRNIADIIRTPRSPVIPYFTAAQWDAAVRGIPLSSTRALSKNAKTIKYLSAPWGSGDVIVYRDLTALDSLSERVRIRCQPRIEVYTTDAGIVVVNFGLSCEAEVATGECNIVFHAFTEKAPKYSPLWHCENEGGNGRCKIVQAGAQTVGDLQCVCRF